MSSIDRPVYFINGSFLAFRWERCGFKTCPKKTGLFRTRDQKSGKESLQRDFGKCSDLGQVEHEFGMTQWSDQDASADKVGEHVVFSDFVLSFNAIRASSETWGREQEQKESNHDLQTDLERRRVLTNNISATRDATAMLPRTKL